MLLCVWPYVLCIRCIRFCNPFLISLLHWSIFVIFCMYFFCKLFSSLFSRSSSCNLCYYVYDHMSYVSGVYVFATHFWFHCSIGQYLWYFVCIFFVSCFHLFFPGPLVVIYVIMCMTICPMYQVNDMLNLYKITYTFFSGIWCHIYNDLYLFSLV